MSDINQDDTSNSQPEIDLDDLDSFSSTFFGQKSDAKEEPAKPSDDSEEDETADDDTVGEPQEEKDESEDDDSGGEEEAEKPEPQGKKPSRFQDRINELTTARREAERRANDLEARLAALETQKTEAPKAEVKTAEAPTPTDTKEDGSEKYPLGEFDPNFIRDLTKHTIAEAQKEADAQRTQTEAQRQEAQKAEALSAEWNEKQGPAKERYPDYSEKVASLEDVFSDVDPAYGEYLAQTVMAMDKGTDVLYYLANNPDEAKDIIKAGATKATIRLGRLESRFFEDEAPPQPKPKVSQAPTPPPTNKGSAGGRKVVPDDTDDLDAFAAKFFKRR